MQLPKKVRECDRSNNKHKRARTPLLLYYMSKIYVNILQEYFIGTTKHSLAFGMYTKAIQLVMVLTRLLLPSFLCSIPTGSNLLLCNIRSKHREHFILKTQWDEHPDQFTYDIKGISVHFNKIWLRIFCISFLKSLLWVSFPDVNLCLFKDCDWKLAT